ncbi:MAG: fatty acid cis/trans isomerase, partial [Gammaproteobacteria bacterium]|nr:fatty acid cis/trans isomerase [Gammaproteobacteria bacterium]
MYLTFLPTTHRKAIRDNWYKGMREGMERDIGDMDIWMTKDVVTGYKTDNPELEFFQHLKRQLGDVIVRDDVINRCAKPPCYAKGAHADKRKADTAMREIASAKGIRLAAFPDVAFVRIKRNGKPEDDLGYTVIRNKAYKNVTSMFKDEKDTEARDYSNDSLTVVDWLEGSYPNFFFSVDIGDVEQFAERYAALQNSEDYERFVSAYGIRRTNSDFWATADWFQDASLREKPVEAGLFDLNRYENR